MKKHHKFSHTTIKHHHDGSHTVTHHHEDGPAGDKEYGRHGHDEMMDGLMDNLSAPNPGEAAANAGDHGVPAGPAAAAGLPAAPAAA